MATTQCPGTADVGDSAGHRPHRVDEGHWYVAKGRRDRVCKTCRRIIQRRYEARYEERVRSSKTAHMRSRRLSQYGLTEDQYAQLLVDANGRCRLCREEAVLEVDHDHATGLVRGMLCGRCNKALGLFRDDPALLARAAAYLLP